MSDNSERDLFDNDSAAKSFEADSDRDIDDYDDGDKDLGVRGQGQVRRSANAAQNPEDESMADAGYGGDDQYGPEEVEEHVDDAGRDNSDGEMMEMQMGKDDGSVDEFDDDEEAEYGEERKKKKRPKGEGRERARDRGDREDVDREKVKKKKKVKRDEDEAEEDKYIEEDYDRMGSKKGKRKRKDDEADENDVEVIMNLVREMDQAYEEDIQCFKAKIPAVNKLKLLPKVESLLKRGAFQKAFIDRTDGLDAMAKWLTKLPNGAPPSLQIKKKLVEIVYQLPVTDEHLKTSDIGKVVYTLRSNPNEDPNLKKLLKDIVDKWTRLITDSANDYAPTQVDVRDRKRIEVSLDDYRQRGMSSLRKSIPRMVNKRSGFDFVHKPQMKESMRSINPRQQSNEECDKIIKDMKRKMGKLFK